MITVPNMLQAQKIRDAIHIQRVSDGYRVYQVGDELPVELQQQPVAEVASAKRAYLHLALAETEIGGTNMYDAAKAYVAAQVAAGRREVGIWWENDTYHVNDPYLIEGATALGAAEYLPAVFARAAELAETL